MSACGSDEGSGGDAGGAAASTSEAADPAAFCEANVDIEAASGGGPEVDFETATPEEIQAALEEFGAALEPLITQVEDTAPEELSEDIDTLASTTREALSTGDESLFETPEFTEAESAVDDYLLAECGYEEINVTAVDFEYEGIPESIPTGTVAVTLTNEGEQSHEFGMARINDGVTTPLEELLALPEEQVLTQVSLVGFAFADPGESDTTFLRLEEPGRYGAACFIPEGTTPDTEGTGAPHFTQGMFAEFTVE